jgi:hypothetical protein
VNHLGNAKRFDDKNTKIQFRKEKNESAAILHKLLLGIDEPEEANGKR